VAFVTQLRQEYVEQARLYRDRLETADAEEEQGRVVNGATDGATLQSRIQRVRTNARSAGDWEAMIEHVTQFRDVSGRSGWSRENPRSVIRLGFRLLASPAAS